MKKTLVKSLALAFVGSLLLAGSAMALPSVEWGVINPTNIVGAPTMTQGTGPSYFIWTDDANRTSWHIRWTGDKIGAADKFTGNIELESASGTFTSFLFEGSDDLDVALTGEWAEFNARAANGFDGIDFTIDSSVSPSFVGFDLKVKKDGETVVENIENAIFLGAGNETVASLGQDEDFAIAAPVPEPATMLLLGTGLAGLAGARRRKNQK